jgi:hypothetical protein
VQGVRDRFGMPPVARGRTVVQVEGDHRLTTDLEAVAVAVLAWLPGVVRRARASQMAASASVDRC